MLVCCKAAACVVRGHWFPSRQVKELEQQIDDQAAEHKVRYGWWCLREKTAYSNPLLQIGTRRLRHLSKELQSQLAAEKSRCEDLEKQLKKAASARPSSTAPAAVPASAAAASQDSKQPAPVDETVSMLMERLDTVLQENAKTKEKVSYLEGVVQELTEESESRKMLIAQLSHTAVSGPCFQSWSP